MASTQKMDAMEWLSADQHSVALYALDHATLADAARAEVSEAFVADVEIDEDDAASAIARIVDNVADAHEERDPDFCARLRAWYASSGAAEEEGRA